MPTTVDARGQACPQPVIMARQALAESGDVTVIVSDAAARDNVAGMARRQGHTVQVEERVDGSYIHITRGPAPGPAAAVGMAVPAPGPSVLFVGADSIGRGPEELGGLLMRTFIHTLTEVSPCPEVLIFMNSGVRLVAEGSPVLEDLRVLAGRGVQLLACGTCLGYLDLKDRVAVGTVSNMYTIAETLLGAGKVIAV